MPVPKLRIGIFRLSEILKSRKIEKSEIALVILSIEDSEKIGINKRMENDESLIPKMKIFQDLRQ